MEALKLARKQHRRVFTKACNEFDQKESNLTNEEKILELRVIQEKAKLMISVENDVKRELYEQIEDERIIEREIDESEAYLDRWRKLEHELNKLLRVSERNTFGLDMGSAPIPPIPNTMLHYPKIKLPTFDGNLKNWLNFWGQFKKIDKDPNIDNQDKFTYLSQAMQQGSVAEELIKSFPPSGESYEKAVKQLQTRFGKDELLIQVYVRDLLALILQKQNAPGWSLRRLYDQLESKLRALEVLGVTREKYAAMLFPLVESSLPDETLRAWERYRTVNRRSRDLNPQHGENTEQLKIAEKSDLDYLLEFLQDEVESEERISLASQTFEQGKFGKSNNKWSTKTPLENKNNGYKSKFGKLPNVPTSAELFTTAQRQKLCIFCSNSHNSWDCRKAINMPLDEREAIAGKSRCCFLCLRPGHQVMKCKVNSSCFLCGKKHHVFLCRKNITSVGGQQPNKETESTEIEAERDQALANVSRTPNVMLQTLTVIFRCNEKKRKARAIIDSASQRSYILDSAAKEMGYKALRNEYLQHSLFGGSNTRVYKHDVLMIYLSNMKGTYDCHFEALSQPVICDTIPPVTSELSLKELKDSGIYPGDQHCGPIDILIGADIAGKLMTGGYKLLPSGLAAVETKLGWTVMGRAPTESSSESTTLISMLNKNACITDLWTLDSLGIRDPSESKTKLELEEAAKSHFLDTVKIENGRFMVSLPWIEGHRLLTDNYDLSLKRLNSTLKKMKSDGLYEEYENVFQDWLREGIIEEVPSNEMDLPCHYLPHRHVVKENSTTRIRPVFDASANEKGSPSLNECLEKGPNLVELIPSILTRFRLEDIGVVADIRKAFLQISVVPTDRNFLRFLWINSDGELRIYRHCRVVFGVSSSPFLLGAVIRYHLQTVLNQCLEGQSIYPKEMIQKLFSSFYVDNCVTSVKNDFELHTFIKVASEVMAERQFDLRGWENTNLSKISLTPTNVLGLLWNKMRDTLGVNISSFENLCIEKITKRTILATAHRIFDPLGITCPIALIPKLLLQRLWKTNINWDQEVDTETKKEFLKWMKDVPFLSKVEVPRSIKFGDVCDKHSLHVFCDASQLAYAAATFLRVERKSSVYVQLIQARARVAPCGKGKTSIARLELLGATIAARLLSNIQKDLPVNEVYCWTDSTTVLAWLRREDAWGIFVHNRVKEILSLTSKENWRYVPGTMNPADLPSRGCSARHFASLKWWEGPEWLYLPDELWPNTEDITCEQEVNTERMKKIVSSMLSVGVSTLLNSHLTNYKRTVNIMAWILRFIYNCRNKQKKKGDLSVADINAAEKVIVYLVQQESFSGLRDKRLQSLDTFLDDKIIRLKSAVFKRDDYEEFRMPAILPGEHPLVKSLVFDKHRKIGHAGVSHTLNSLRERYWILCGRRTVKHVLSSCIICKRYSAKYNNPPTAPPPADRVQDAAVFQVTGVDFAGPVILRDGSKAWIALFTCAVYRAVHLELVTSMSTETFLLALHRFVARRGKPSIVYSDNGTNFIGASNALTLIDFEKIFHEARKERITWKFIPPSSPWWGGWWERLVGMMKNILRKTLGRASLSYEEMVTTLCNCESILNDRPLTTISADPSLTALTPANFLKEIKSSTIPDLRINPNANGFRRRLQYIQTVREAFRKRFRQEYLGVLCKRQRHQEFTPLKEGDIVLIGDDEKKRLSWPLGRIVKILPGVDGVVRRARIKTERGELIRAVQKLYPLELSSFETLPETAQKEVKVKSKNEKQGAGARVLKEDFTERVKIKGEHPQTTSSGRVIKAPKKLSL